MPHRQSATQRPAQRRSGYRRYARFAQLRPPRLSPLPRLVQPRPWQRLQRLRLPDVLPALGSQSGPHALSPAPGSDRCVRQQRRQDRSGLPRSPHPCGRYSRRCWRSALPVARDRPSTGRPDWGAKAGSTGNLSDHSWPHPGLQHPPHRPVRRQHLPRQSPQLRRPYQPLCLHPLRRCRQYWLQSSARLIASRR